MIALEDFTTETSIALCTSIGMAIEASPGRRPGCEGTCQGAQQRNYDV